MCDLHKYPEFVQQHLHLNHDVTSVIGHNGKYDVTKQHVNHFSQVNVYTITPYDSHVQHTQLMLHQLANESNPMISTI